jgi:hypothetical protein
VCTSHDATNIISHGLDLSRCRVDADFGREFYTTMVKYQARQWARNRFHDPAVSRIRPNQPVILQFLLDRDDLAGLVSIGFVLGGRSETAGFWSLVQRRRQSTPSAINDHRGPVSLSDGTRWDDMACGPVATLWRQRVAMQDADQFSFHTPRGLRVLQRLIDCGSENSSRYRPVT